MTTKNSTETLLCLLNFLFPDFLIFLVVLICGKIKRAFHFFLWEARWLASWSSDRAVWVFELWREQCCVLEQKLHTQGPVSRKTRNLTGPKSYFEIKFSRKVGCVLTSNGVHFVSLADNFTVQFSKLLKLLSRMKNKTA